MNTLTHIALHVEDLPAVEDFYARYCGMVRIHERRSERSHIVWLAEPGQETLGFALDSKDAVDRLAEQARQEGRLLWEPREEDWPVGYYCGVLDPNGHQVEFSFGQPLGPGARPLDQY